MPRCQRNTGATDGFTLLEALVAIALMATILTALATITAQWLPNWNRGMDRIQQGERITLALERLSADLAAAEFIRTTSEPRRVLFDGTERSVTFIRSAFGPNIPPGLQIVRIAEHRDTGSNNLLRMTAPFRPAITPNEMNQVSFSDPVVLLRAPFQVSFSYAGMDRKWREAWRLQSQLPKAVKFGLRNVATQASSQISTAIRVQAEIPIDCLSAKSLADCLSQIERTDSAVDGKARI